MCPDEWGVALTMLGPNMGNNMFAMFWWDGILASWCDSNIGNTLFAIVWFGVVPIYEDSPKSGKHFAILWLEGILAYAYLVWPQYW